MGRYRGIDSDEGWIRRKIGDLERQIRELAAARRLQGATVGEGGVTIKDGGSMWIEPGGKVVVYGTGVIGTMQDGAFGMATDDGVGGVTTPSMIMLVDGFLADAGPGLGYAVFRVDETTGAAVITSSTSKVLLPYLTTSDVANTRILLNGQILMVTSSRRYKREIEDAVVDIRQVLKMRGRTWRDKRQVEEDPATTDRYIGFIAEELHDLGLSEFVGYDPEGNPDSVAYDRLTVALLEVVKDLDKRVAALEAWIQVPKASKGSGK